MISRFKRLFKRIDGDELRAFQQSVLELLREQYPGRAIKATEDPLMIIDGENKFGLSNVHAKFLLTAQTTADLKEIVSDHFGKVLAQMSQIDDEKIGWDDAKPRLMPQLMPVDFTMRMPVVNQPVGDQVRLGFVVDGGDTYSYVTESDIEYWNVDVAELREAAFDNLHHRSEGIEMTAVDGENAFIAVSTQDGFDAVRIISDNFREYFGNILGFPYYAAVPNRDFLICWSSKGDREFQHQMRSQVSQDFNEQPYPLSGYIFIVSEDGQFSQIDREGKGTSPEFAQFN